MPLWSVQSSGDGATGVARWVHSESAIIRAVRASEKLMEAWQHGFSDLRLGERVCICTRTGLCPRVYVCFIGLLKNKQGEYCVSQ